MAICDGDDNAFCSCVYGAMIGRMQRSDHEVRSVLDQLENERGGVRLVFLPPLPEFCVPDGILYKNNLTAMGKAVY